MDERWQDGAPLGKDPTYRSPTHAQCEGPYFFRAISFMEAGSDLHQFWAVALNVQLTRHDNALTFLCKQLVTLVSF